MRQGITAIIGGALVGTGAILPWLSLFAGLQSYSGMIGLYGRLLFGGGVLAVAGGVAILVRSYSWLRAGSRAPGASEVVHSGIPRIRPDRARKSPLEAVREHDIRLRNREQRLTPRDLRRPTEEADDPANTAVRGQLVEVHYHPVRYHSDADARQLARGSGDSLAIW